MRKQEYIHLHRLLLEVTRYLADREVVQERVFREYDSFGTNPNFVHAPKEKHHEVLTFLSTAITTELDQSREEDVMIGAQ